MNTSLLTLALALGIALAGPASAEPTAQARITSVSTAGLDLTTDEGLRALDLRILHAASALCGTPSPADARGLIRFKACREDARLAVAARRDRIVQIARDRRDVELALTR